MSISACSCDKCRAECRRLPGWFAPEEAARAIGAGLAHRLTAVHQQVVLAAGRTVSISAEIVALAPAPCGHEGVDTNFGGGRCTFLKNDGMCEIHDSGFKPIECVTGFACRPCSGPDVGEMAKMWGSREGRAALLAWRFATKGGES